MIIVVICPTSLLLSRFAKSTGFLHGEIATLTIALSGCFAFLRSRDYIFTDWFGLGASDRLILLSCEIVVSVSALWRGLRRYWPFWLSTDSTQF